MHVITCASGKGGSGRSTTTLALATHAHHAKHKTTIIDLDAGQGVLQRWVAMREKAGPEVITPEGKIRNELRKLDNAGTDYVFIDTEPAIDAGRVVEAGVAFCDLCLIPVRPSIFDVTSIGAVVEMCEELGKLCAIVLVDVDDRKPWKGVTDSAAKVLRKQGTLLTARLSHNVAFVNALTRGLTGGEINADAKSETADLWEEVLALLPKRARNG